MSPIDRLTAEKRHALAEHSARTGPKPEDFTRREEFILAARLHDVDFVLAVIAATSEPAIKAGDEVFPGGVALPADAIDALSFQKFQPKRISDLMQQTRDHRAWVEADKAIAIDESRMKELAALREKLADEKKLHDQTRGWLRDEKAKVADFSARLDHSMFRPVGDNHHNAEACPHCSPKRAKLVARAESAECERDKWKASSHEYHEAAHEATAELHKTQAKLSVAESSLAELRAAVDKYGCRLRSAAMVLDGKTIFTVASWRDQYDSASAACLAAYHAENAETKEDDDETA